MNRHILIHQYGPVKIFVSRIKQIEFIKLNMKKFTSNSQPSDPFHREY